MTKIQFMKWAKVFCFCAFLFGAFSCADDKPEPKPEPVTLESPKAGEIVVTPSEDGTKATITWQEVEGAGGYEFSFFNVDDPAAPVVVGEEKQVIEGCSVERDLSEDTKYSISIRTLGSTKHNTKDAEAASEAAFTTLSTAVASIPDGVDLSAYFTETPIPASNAGLVYELVAGGNYTMSADINIGLTNVTIRGDKLHHATITMNAGCFMSEQGAYTLKFVDLECSNFTAASVFNFSYTMNAAAMDNGWITVSSPFVIQSCNIKNLTKRLYYDNNMKYAVKTLMIKDCVIEQNHTGEYAIYWRGGFIKDCILVNSTFYNQNSSNINFIQGNANRATSNTNWGWTSAGLDIRNCTFWQVSKGGQMGNYAGLSVPGVGYLTLHKNIFVDCGNRAVVRRFLSGATNMARSLDQNSYWFDGAFVTGEIAENYDNSGTHLETDPRLKDPANGDFTVQGPGQLAIRAGDPRWLPAQ